MSILLVLIKHPPDCVPYNPVQTEFPTAFSAYFTGKRHFWEQRYFKEQGNQCNYSY